MKIYLGDTEIKKGNHASILELLGEVDQNVVGNVLKKDNKYYIVHTVADKETAFAEEIDFCIDGKKELYKDEIKCPFCGETELDSWGWSDSDTNYECEKCGSIFSYYREMITTYSSAPINASVVIDI